MNFFCGGKRIFVPPLDEAVWTFICTCLGEVWIYILLRNVKWVLVLAWMLDLTLLVFSSDFRCVFFLLAQFLSEFPYCFRHKIIHKLNSHLLSVFWILLKIRMSLEKWIHFLLFVEYLFKRTLKFTFFCFEIAVFQLLPRGSLCKSSAEYLELGFCGQMKKWMCVAFSCFQIISSL